MSFDVESFRKCFPQLERKMGPKPLVYFDSGASTLKHSAVTDRLNTYNRFETSNVHRGAHHTSQQGTANYEGARNSIKTFLNADDERSIIFTRGTTESVNFVAATLESQIKEGDEILITPFEHHSNIVPWQMLCEKTGAQLKVVPFSREFGVTLDDFKSSLTEKTRLAAIIYHSNSFGNRLPVEEMIAACRDAKILTLIDGAQSITSEKVDLQELGCDFFCFSGHKIFGPYGIGVLYIHPQHLETWPPYQTGGSMIDRVTFGKTVFANAPQRFEAGTPNISGAIGLGEAIKVLDRWSFPEQHEHVMGLRGQLKKSLLNRQSIELYEFQAQDYAGIVSFNIKGTHPSDVGTLLDKYGFAVRAGHHCTQPLMDLLGIPGTVRVSLAAYNTQEEVENFVQTLDKIEEFF